MARTDVRKLKESVRVPCPIPGFEDEFHFLKPATRDLSSRVDEKSKIKEFRRGQLVQETDTKLFVDNYLDAIWVGWEQVGIVHDDGHIEDPAECTYANKLILANSRPIDFLLWLQRTAEDLASQAQQQTVAQRDNFRQADALPAGESGTEV